MMFTDFVVILNGVYLACDGWLKVLEYKLYGTAIIPIEWMATKHVFDMRVDPISLMLINLYLDRIFN